MLGPVLFVIYINDLSHNIGDTNVSPYAYLFADDLAVSVSNNKNTVTDLLDQTSLKVKEWCDANALALNNNKTVDITFNISRSVHNINSKNGAKFLGIYIDQNLGWETHVNYISGKISKNIFILRVLKQKLCEKSLITIYYSYIHSHLSYGILLWGNHSTANKLFILQKRAMRIICGAPPRSHCRSLFVYLGILTLPSVFVLSCLLYVKENISILYVLLCIIIQLATTLYILTSVNTAFHSIFH